MKYKGNKKNTCFEFSILI